MPESPNVRIAKYEEAIDRFTHVWYNEWKERRAANEYTHSV